MPSKIRQLAARTCQQVLAIAALPLLLSGCDAAMNMINPPSPPPTVNVADVTRAPPTPDTPPLYCKIGHGSALFGREWYDFGETEFQLHRGQPADVTLTRLRSPQQMSIQALFDGSGQKLIFCPYLTLKPNNATPAADQRISCASLYALDDDLRDGIKRTFDIPAAERGGAITCAYSPERLKSLTPPSGGN